MSSCSMLSVLGFRPSSLGIAHREFAKRLWGDFYFRESDRSFRKAQVKDGPERSFVQFILEPLYKFYAQVLGESPGTIHRVSCGFSSGQQIWRQSGL